ncbi:AAA family ATPase [Thermoflavimicrobium dichotomicum]|uniref:MoxR-like ATPase n=1 Tax=Thermoflavimicrobium dichotomicum TaxID=46223 RepID=A0A1I3RTZ6_9BACL|nr:MoxR family ATPase [Thermoflavimicrobium dichotomicum]SFJ50034.1 MoxR-like ATPase [Thermoflavimicrobium dichotomicum]
MENLFASKSGHIQSITHQVLSTMEKAVIGQMENIRLLWGSLLVGGHALIEGVPGLGKTLMVRALAQVIQCHQARIQFTPDLMPSDITGTKVYDLQTGHFSFRKGPIFTHILLADEINRTPPKTQAALLEAMEEKQVTIDGETYLLPSLFFVVATQNPVEHEGTYVLPEAQIDRFTIKLLMDYPTTEQETLLLSTHQINVRREMQLEPVVSIEEIIALRQELKEVTVEPSIVRYVLAIIQATRNHPKVYLGASPRAGLDVLSMSKAEAAMNGRNFVTPDDVRRILKPTLRHRLLMHPDGELEGWKADDILEEIIQAIPVPR